MQSWHQSRYMHCNMETNEKGVRNTGGVRSKACDGSEGTYNCNTYQICYIIGFIKSTRQYASRRAELYT